MGVVTRTELENASIDAGDLAEVVNGPASPGIVETRYGSDKKTLAKLESEAQARIDALGVVSYYSTKAAGVAATDVDGVFISDEDGSMTWYRHTATNPFYSLIGLVVSGPVVVVAIAGTPAAKYADYVCDGTADQVQINAAIDYVNGLGGGEVRVKAGLYLVNSDVVVKSNVDLNIEIGATIRVTANYVPSGLVDASAIVMGVSASNWKVRGGGTIDGATNNVAVNGIAALSSGAGFTGPICTDFVIRDMTVKLAKLHVYHIWSMKGQRGSIIGNYVDGGYTENSIYTGSESQEGIELYGARDMVIRDNRVQGVGGAAYNFGGGTDIAGDYTLSNCLITNNSANICGRFMQIQVSSHVTNGMGSMERCVFDGNRAENVFVRGIDIQFINYNNNALNGDPIVFKDNSFTDNIIQMAATGQVVSSRGIYVHNQRAPSGIDASNNLFARNKFMRVINTEGSGRCEFRKMSGFSFVGNSEMTLGGTGNSYPLMLIDCADFQADDNILAYAGLYGVYTEGCNRGSISRNRIRHWNESAIGVTGIIVLNGITPSFNLRIRDNMFWTYNLTGVPSLVYIVAGSSHIDYTGNFYDGSEYQGPTVVCDGTNPMNLATTFPQAMLEPGGRLTLVAGTSVMTSTNQGAAIYYTPHNHAGVPIYNGGMWLMRTFQADLSNILADSATGKAGPAAVANNSNYDLFIWQDGSDLRLTRGPAWTSDTARGTGAGTSQLERQNGLWVNAYAITNGPAAKRGTYVGTMRSNGSAQIEWTLGGSATGGIAAKLNIWNAYNRIPITASVSDIGTAGTWTYNAATWRSANNSNTNRISIIKGLDEDLIEASYSCLFTGTSAYGQLGLGVNSTTTPSGLIGYVPNGATVIGCAEWKGFVGIGYSYIQALEWANANTVTFSGGTLAPSVTCRLNINAHF